MPMPKPRQGESKDDFVTRFMGDEAMTAEYPDNGQRRAVAEAQWDKAHAAFSDTRTLRDEEVFAVGKHNGLKFTHADLEELAKSRGKMPIKIGHNDEQPLTDGQPALGWMENVRKVGGKLIADFVDVPKIVVEAIKKKLYTQKSVEMEFAVDKDGNRSNQVLTGIALLGADLPAVKTLNDLQVYLSSQPGDGRIRKFFNFQAEEESIMTPEEIKALQEENARLKADNAGLEKDKALFKQQEEQREANERNATIKANRDTITEKLEKAVKDETILPAQREAFSQILNVTNDDAMFSVDVKVVDTLIGAEESKKAAFSQDQGRQGGKDEIADPSAELTKLTHIHMSKNSGVDFSTALQQVMLAEPELAEAYSISNGIVKEA